MSDFGASEEALARTRAMLAGEAEARAHPLGGMSKPELRRLGSEIAVRLGDPVDIGGLNLENELVSQYAKVKSLQDEVLDDETIPPNQRAQVAGQVVSTLAQLVRMQEDLQKGEHLKLMEGCLIEAIKMLPQEVKDAFFSEYERLAEQAGLT